MNLFRGRLAFLLCRLGRDAPLLGGLLTRLLGQLVLARLRARLAPLIQRSIAILESGCRIGGVAAARKHLKVFAHPGAGGAEAVRRSLGGAAVDEGGARCLAWYQAAARPSAWAGDTSPRRRTEQLVDSIFCEGQHVTPDLSPLVRARLAQLSIPMREGWSTVSD